ncbi:hypothetical protein HAX54_025806 [Datura stramonium]|uniref:Uncharacterized protein n=1 Tax=Datura stramonium TaxID=4076 RepID=A0ABS8V0U1_DATST|nr:hypothetical protein [Datura stramonium]
MWLNSGPSTVALCWHGIWVRGRKSWRWLCTSHPTRVKPRKHGKSFSKAITNNRIMFEMSTFNLDESRRKASTLLKKDGMETYGKRDFSTRAEDDD